MASRGPFVLRRINGVDMLRPCLRTLPVGDLGESVMLLDFTYVCHRSPQQLHLKVMFSLSVGPARELTIPADLGQVWEVLAPGAPAAPRSISGCLPNFMDNRDNPLSSGRHKVTQDRETGGELHFHNSFYSLRLSVSTLHERCHNAVRSAGQEGHPEPPASSPILVHPCARSRLALQEKHTITGTAVDTAQCVGLVKAICTGTGGDSTSAGCPQSGFQSR